MEAALFYLLEKAVSSGQRLIVTLTWCLDTLSDKLSDIHTKFIHQNRNVSSSDGSFHLWVISKYVMYGVIGGDDDRSWSCIYSVIFDFCNISILVSPDLKVVSQYLVGEFLVVDESNWFSIIQLPPLATIFGVEVRKEHSCCVRFAISGWTVNPKPTYIWQIFWTRHVVTSETMEMVVVPDQNVWWDVVPSSFDGGLFGVHPSLSLQLSSNHTSESCRIIGIQGSLSFFLKVTLLGTVLNVLI